MSPSVSELNRYLRQIRELYGDALILERTGEKRVNHHGSATGDLFEGDGEHSWEQAESLDELYERIRTCRKCPLCETRTNFVFGTGSPHAGVVLIGEAPGAEEDLQGEPFVGRAGQLLNKILGAIGFRRDEVYICNILKCRPPNNRDPLPSEVEKCEPYLHRQLDLIRPRIILALGRIAAQTLLRTTDSLTVLRAGRHSYRGIPLVVTYHPAALLRNPGWKRPTWEDVQRFRSLYDGLCAGDTV
ncbi:MAG: uracil-DNA glycosylase [Bacteroidota bacterium]|nr:uracil-DNA glycosylase [Bacteroidota bacterium]